MGVTSFWRGGWINKVLVVIGGAMAVSICGGMIFYPEVSSFLGVSSQARRPSTVATLPPADVGPQGDIPGLNAATLAETYTAKGYTCEGPEQSDGVYKRVCTKESDNGVKLQLEIYGREELSVDRLVATVFQAEGAYDFKIAADFLKAVAFVNYTGSAGDQGRSWVSETLGGMRTIGGDSQIIFGGVMFHLFGPGTQRTLEMTKP